ncbi:recombinase family protein [Kribbella sp. NPDC004875]|uniref:recombinase family protein n=1 Tax=Kribbella sp. NPDC004875 TaxID=3364107 RepID=UPI0036A73303
MIRSGRSGAESIAEALNVEAIPCPSVHTPQQNRHRRGDGWQHTTVKAILENPRYTGFAIYGRWQKVEELLDPEDVAAGHVVRFRRSPQSKIVRSREPADPAIVSVDTFTRLRRALEAGWDPAALTEQYNAAVAEKRSAEAEFSALKVPERVSAEDIRKMVQELGDMTAALDQADASDMRSLYKALGLQVSYNHETRSAEAAVSPALRGFNVGVRGGT